MLDSGCRAILLFARGIQPSSTLLLYNRDSLLIHVRSVLPSHLLLSISLNSRFSDPLVALITCDLGVMLEITGGVSATALAFILPAACYIKLVDKRLPWYSRTKLPAVICATFGAIV